MGTPGQHVGAVGRRGVVALPGDDHRTIWQAQHQRLVTGGMSGRRDQQDAGQYLCLASQLLIVGAGRIDQLRQRVVLRTAGIVQLGGLREYWAADQKRVASAVIEMQVTVCREGDLVQSRPGAVKPSPAAAVVAGNGRPHLDGCPCRCRIAASRPGARRDSPSMVRRVPSLCRSPPEGARSSRSPLAAQLRHP